VRTGRFVQVLDPDALVLLTVSDDHQEITRVRGRELTVAGGSAPDRLREPLSGFDGHSLTVSLLHTPDAQLVEWERTEAVGIPGWEAGVSLLAVKRDDCMEQLRSALESLGVREGQIELPILWPAIARWWSTPIEDLGPNEEDNLAFLLSLSPARRDEHDTVFAGAPPRTLAGRELVCLEFERSFSVRLGPTRSRVIGGGGGLAFWYEYGPSWRSLRERASWIELGYSTPQLDASSFGSDAESLIRYVEQESGVLSAATERALAFEFGGRDDDEELVVVGPSAL
jgi:hypothetical protein